MRRPDRRSGIVGTHLPPPGDPASRRSALRPDGRPLLLRPAGTLRRLGEIPRRRPLPRRRRYDRNARNPHGIDDPDLHAAALPRIEVDASGLERQSEERAARRARPGVDRGHRPLRRERFDVAEHRGVLRHPVDLGHREPLRRQNRHGRAASGDPLGASRSPHRIQRPPLRRGHPSRGYRRQSGGLRLGHEDGLGARSPRPGRLPAPVRRLPLRRMERPCLRSLAAAVGVCLRRVRNQGGRDLRIHLLRPPRTGRYQRFDMGSQTVPIRPGKARRCAGPFPQGGGAIRRLADIPLRSGRPGAPSARQPRPEYLPKDRQGISSRRPRRFRPAFGRFPRAARASGPPHGHTTGFSAGTMARQGPALRRQRTGTPSVVEKRQDADQLLGARRSEYPRARLRQQRMERPARGLLPAALESFLRLSERRYGRPEGSRTGLFRHGKSMGRFREGVSDRTARRAAPRGRFGAARGASALQGPEPHAPGTCRRPAGTDDPV